MSEKEIKPVVIDVYNTKPMISEDLYGPCYESRMVMDKLLSGVDPTININHGTVKAHHALGGGSHKGDEVYYIISGKGKLTLGETVYEIHGGMAMFIPKGTFHALDNSESDEDMTILTLWPDPKYNDAYQERLQKWGTSYKTVDED